MVHIHEKIDFTVTAFIVHEDKVLLRFHDKYKRWLGIGGHIELNEDPSEAVMREVKEESGLDIKLLTNDPTVFSDGGTDLPLPAFINRHYAHKPHEHIDLIYIAKALTTEIKPESTEENEDVKFEWLSAEQLAGLSDDLWPRTQHHASQAIKIAQQYDR